MKTRLRHLMHVLFLIVAAGLSWQVYAHCSLQAEYLVSLYQNMGVEAQTQLAWRDLLETLSLSLYQGATEQREQLQHTASLASEHGEMASRYIGLLLFAALLWLLLALTLQPVPRRALPLYLLVLALLCLPLGVLTPMLQVTATDDIRFLGTVIFQYDIKSIASTITHLFRHGEWVTGGLILLFSIVIPLLKLFFSLVHLLRPDNRLGMFSHRLIHHLGRWSMADVFVIAILLSVFAQDAGKLTTADTGPGLYFFAAYCLLSLLGSHLMLSQPVHNREK